MRTLATALLVLMLLTTAGTRVRSPTIRRPDPALSKLLADGNRLFRQREYLRAREVYDEGYRRSVRLGDAASAVRFLINIGSGRFATYQYRGALEAYLEAKRLAVGLGDVEMAAAVSANLSSLYLQLEQPNAEIAAERETLELVRKEGRSKYLPLLLTQHAVLNARAGDAVRAEAQFRDAIDQAERIGDTGTHALASNRFGYFLLKQGRLDNAEGVLLDAFRLGKLYRLDELDYSYYILGLLKLERGEFPIASRLLDEAVKRASRGRGTMPLWRLYLARGRVRFALGRLKEAFDDLEVALEFARQWRAEFPSSDTVWTNATAELQSVYAAYISAAARLHFDTGGMRYAQRAFAAAEENRAAGLQALARASGNQRMPVEYWQTLAQLRASETEMLRTGSQESRRRTEDLSFRLSEIEARSGSESPTPSRPGPLAFEGFRKSLQPSDALLSFHLGDTESYLWELTRESFRMRPLPHRSRLASMVKEFSAAVRSGGGHEAAERLYSVLFSQLSQSVLRKPHWTIRPEHELFEAPLAALVTGHRTTGPTFLLESHSLTTSPAELAGGWKPFRNYGGTFLGVGDAVYNGADPRRPTESRTARGGFFRLLPSVFARHSPVESIEMERLAGSGAEIRACAKVWSDESSRTVVLDGVDASRNRLWNALRLQPAAIHFATHFVMSPGRPRQPMIALSLGLNGKAEFLTAAEIRHWRLEAPVVVLSGCSSGSAEVLPGEGLLGMSRAWLAAGAEAVVASLWPVTDDTGALFVSFYRHLRRGQSDGSGPMPAAALRGAQLEMLRSGTWRAEPRYWAAHFVAGRK